MSWSWSLLGWGAVIGVVGVLGSYEVGRRAHIETNHWTAYRGFVVLSAAVTALAAALNSAWIVVGFGVYVLVANFVVPLALITRARRVIPHACSSGSDSCSADACAACPLSAQAKAATASA
jgi:hypothetical protein